MKVRMFRHALSLLVVFAVSASAQSTQKCKTCEDETARLERAARIEALRADLTRLVREARQMDTLTVRLLSEALAKLSETEIRLKQLPKERTAATATVVAGSSSRYGYPTDAAMPTGYMGISLSGNTDVIPGRDELVVRYKDTPIIESVEPGSPAEEAGLASGDVILAYNGEELKGRTVSLTKLLKPGARVVVRVRRSGSTRDIPVLLGRRAQYVTYEKTPMARGSGGMLTEPGFVWRIDTVETPMPPAPRAPRAPRAPATTPPPATPAELLPPLLPGSGSAIAGAELTASNRQLGEYFGVSRGIVVLHVAEGTPARKAGLRVGDVITTCEGEPVSRPSELQDALWRAKSRGRVSLEVQRRPEAGQPLEKKIITLRW